MYVCKSVITKMIKSSQFKVTVRREVSYRFNLDVKAKIRFNFLGCSFDSFSKMWWDDPTLADDNAHQAHNTVMQDVRHCPWVKYQTFKGSLRFSAAHHKPTVAMTRKHKHILVLLTITPVSFYYAQEENFVDQHVREERDNESTGRSFSHTLP